MAIYYARANGNVNATNVWSTTQAGATSDLFPSFTSSDILMANGFTVTININTTVAELRSDNAGGATQGGSFTLGSNITLIANIFAGTTNNCVNFNSGSPAIANIIGNITGGTQVTGGPVGCVALGGTGTLNITGNITGGSAVNSNGVRNLSTGTINITGNVLGGSLSEGVTLSSAGTINITGTITGGQSSTGGVLTTSTGTINIFGTAIGGSGTGAGVIVNSTAASVVTAIRAKGNGFGNGSIGLNSAVGVANNSQVATVMVYEIEYGDLGQSPTGGPVFLFPSSSNVALFYRSGTTKKTLVDASNSSGLLPSTSDVRSGITYNAGNNIGTMGVPSAQSVALGVPVDNTTGTAVLTTDNIGDIWNYPVSGISVSNSIGERLKNCSTVASMGQQLAAALNNIQ